MPVSLVFMKIKLESVTIIVLVLNRKLGASLLPPVSLRHDQRY